MMRLRLPYPVSANVYWRHITTGRRVMVIVSDKAKAFRRDVDIACRAARISEPFIGPVSVDVTLHPRLRKRGGASNMVMDLDNALKVLFDALQGHAFIRDSQVRRLHAEYGEAVEDGGVTVLVDAYDELAA